MRRRQPAFAIPVAPSAPAPRRVLGIDPGSVRTGWGVVDRDGNRARGVAAGVIRVKDSAPLGERLHAIHRGICEVLEEHKPDAVALEDIFFARYAQAALVLGHARGVALLAATQAGLSVSTYPPAVVKRAVVGSGRAEKTQVAQLVAALLGMRELPGLDATDALAIAITHINVSRLGI
ncbi:MAG TPA: crossover junction endodeoxyribonuclease RuvC [Polyangiales bacterium]|nr:crossover junction endodeoxyribonuclease RuvC [Polyangiales bacterium]